MAPPGRVATLILPADASWNEADGPAPLPPVEGRAPVAPEAISEVARVLRSGEPAVLFMGGHALREPGLMLAGRIAAKTGARLLAQTLNARVERGAGRVAVDFLPYPVDDALATLAGARHLLLVDCPSPVAFFAYPGRPSSLVPPGCAVHSLGHDDEDVLAALEALADQVAADAEAESSSRGCRSPPAPRKRARSGRATSVTPSVPPLPARRDRRRGVDHGPAPACMSGGTLAAAPHDWLAVTGGAIGSGCRWPPARRSPAPTAG